MISNDPRLKKSFDPSVTNWFNVLHDMRACHILKLGTGSENTIQSILAWGCTSLVCVGPPSDVSHPALSCFGALEEIHGFSFDICLIDEFEVLKRKSKGQLMALLAQIYTRLSHEGVLMIGLPNGIGDLALKRALNFCLKTSGYTAIDTYYCEPEFQRPWVIFPDAMPKIQYFKLLFGMFYIEPTLRRYLKAFFKTCSAVFLPTVSSLVGTMLVAHKHIDKHVVSDGVPLRFAEAGLSRNTPGHCVWLAKAHEGKHLAFVIGESKKNAPVSAVAKQISVAYSGSDTIRQEHRNLQMLVPFSEDFKRHGFVIPRPIGYALLQGKPLSLETGLSGQPLARLKHGWLRDPVVLARHVNRLVSILIHVHDALTRRLRDSASVIPDRYYENSSNLPDAYSQAPVRNAGYRGMVQHGDFTDVNIVYDENKDLWGIFDWEWMGTGFPPFFDLYFLLASLGFRSTTAGDLDHLGNYRQSMIETFYSKNWFSDLAVSMITTYARFFDVPVEKCRDYFWDFLLFQYNKHRLDYQSPGYTELFESMLAYAIAHPHAFIMSQ